MQKQRTATYKTSSAKARARLSNIAHERMERRKKQTPISFSIRILPMLLAADGRMLLINWITASDPVIGSPPGRVTFKVMNPLVIIIKQKVELRFSIYYHKLHD